MGTRLDQNDPIVALKLELLEHAMPANSAIVFGDIYIVEGSYTARCAELGCDRVVLIDSLETRGWLQTRCEHPVLDFYKGDFSDPLFMKSIRERFDVSVVYDVLLHQPPLLATLHLMLELTRDRICVCQPMLKERDTPNTLIYLPGNRDSSLYPLAERSPEYKVFDISAVNQSNWIWGMTPSLLTSVLLGEGFEIRIERAGPDLANPLWMWWGCVAERRRGNSQHWSRTIPSQGLYQPDWATPARTQSAPYW